MQDCLAISLIDPSCSLLDGKEVLASFMSSPIPGRTNTPEDIQQSVIQMVASLDPIFSGPGFMPAHTTGAIATGVIKSKIGTGIVVRTLENNSWL